MDIQTVYTVIQIVLGVVLVLIIPVAMFWADRLGGR